MQESISGEFPSIYGDIVPAGLDSRKADFPKCADDDRALPHHVIVLPGHNEGEVKVSHVMEYRPSTGHPAGKLHPVPTHRGQVAFPPWVLIAADDHRIMILPKE